MGGLEFALKETIEIGLGFRVAGGADQILLLEGIVLIVEEEPGTTEVPDVRVAQRAKAAEFPAALFAHPFTKRRDTRDESSIIGRVFSTANVTAEIEAFDGAGDRHAAETEKGWHDVFGIDQSGQFSRTRAKSSRPAEEQRDADGFIIWLLLVPPALRAEHIAVVGGKENDGVAVESGFMKRAQQVPNTLIQC